jgi:hypothetical protein
MIGFWTAVCVLAGVSLANLLLLLGLTARVRVLHRAASKAQASKLPAPGVAVKRFEVTTKNGDRITNDNSLGAPTLVGFFSAGCVACEQVKAQLLKAPPALPILAFVHGSEEVPEIRAIGSAFEAIGRVIYFEDNQVARAFGAVAYPTLLRIEEGSVAASGRKLQDVLA